MPERRRNVKEIRKDQRTPRETRDELLESARSTDVQPQNRDPNRDRARGDWDRTGRHHDEEEEG